MILHALHNYYERMASQPSSEMPAFGTSVENVSYALVLSEDGAVQGIDDLRELEGKKLRPKKLAVPAALKRSGKKPPPNFLWDNTTYVLGLDSKGNPERAKLCNTAFTELVTSKCDESDSGLKAVINFLQGGFADEIALREDWPEICDSNLVFRLDGVSGFIHDRPAAKEAWANCLADRKQDVTGQCLVLGVQSPIARLHPAIKGIRGAKSSGASLVSFDKSSFGSYGKEQSFNAPVSQKVAFTYTAALNYLLSNKSRKNVLIGDTSYVFWAQRDTPVEDVFADLFDLPEGDSGEGGTADDASTADKIKGLLEAIRDGKRPVDFMPSMDEDVQFFILGLAPNRARLSIRFWESNRLGAVLERVGKHYAQMRIDRQFDSEPEFPPLWRLLCQTATLGKTENISPVLAGGLTRAMLTGAAYPQTLLTSVLERIRAEHNVTYFRAALLKAFLMRNKQKEVPVSFDHDRKDLPYLLGRLFAVLEKAQEEAVPGANATIKDRYLSAAAATPGQVFHLLIKGSANHISKIKKDAQKRGRAIYLDGLIQDIIAELSDYPRTQNSEDQGLFMIGYYHQRKDFYTKKNQEG